MCPTLFTIPWVNLPIRGYGLMLMVAFLGGTWWASRRAARVKQDPDFVVNLGFVALICSVIGARIFYVAHYWERFEGRNLWEIANLTAGGMEFYGGFIGGMVGIIVFMLVRRVSFRLYFDILAPSLMLGMAAARIGCFLNGCCWGAPAPPQGLPWAVRFPYASPAEHRQWEDRQMTLPAELIAVYSSGQAYPLGRDLLDVGDKAAAAQLRQWREAQADLKKAQASGADSATLAKLNRQVDRAKKRLEASEQTIQPLQTQAQRFDINVGQLERMARATAYHSLPVHPAQLYASLDALVMALLLSAIFYRRKRHGVVTGIMFILYPLCRIVEEIIRIDNPHDAAGLTISQFVSVMGIAIGIAWLVAIYRMPLRSPRAVPFVWPPEPAPVPKKHGKKSR